jgi:hypothetical protein
MDLNDKNIFKTFEEIFDISDDGDKHSQADVSLTVGVVVDTDDPLQMGRLRVFCPSLNDDPRKLQHLPWAAYVSPFGGVVDNNCFARGSDVKNFQTSGPVHYGFWAIPEQGAHALVGCVDGDPRRRFWLGCFPSQQQTHTIFTGRFKWSGFNGTPDGPFSSNNDPIQPLYNNLTTAFTSTNPSYAGRNTRFSSEWKTRGADYQPTAVSQDVGEFPNTKDTTYLDEQNDQITVAEPDQWVKDILGAHGYDWTAFKNLGSFLASKVYGFGTPGGHSIWMDDRPFNCRVKLRTTSGHQILMDDTNERIYIATAKGNNWIEMDQAGNIDVYSSSRVSVHAASDINFSTEGSFRVKAQQGIFMYAGNATESPLSEPPNPGQIRLTSTDDMHIYSEANIRTYSKENTYIQSNSNIDVVAAAQFAVQVGSSSIAINTNDIVLISGENIFFEDSTPADKTNLMSIIASINTKQEGTGTPVPIVPPPQITIDPSASEISLWTNRVPQHEPWPRVLMQNSTDPQNQINVGYKHNVQWVPQFDNTTSPAGMEPIGKVEGDQNIPRGMFWRR